MGTVTATTIINRAAILLQDVTNIRWPRTELLDWIHEAQQYIVAVKPGANAVIATKALAAGTLQALPTNGASLIDVPRNLPGRAVRVVTREILDAQIPGWHSTTATAEVIHYVYDANVPTSFYVYPPNTGTGNIELVYAATPTALANETSAISLNDFFAPAVLNYVMYRAYSKDSDYSSNDANAVAYFKAFEAALSGKQAFEGATNPNMALAQLNPNTVAGTK